MANKRPRERTNNNTTRADFQSVGEVGRGEALTPALVDDTYRPGAPSPTPTPSTSFNTKCLLSQKWSPLSSVDERDPDAPYGAIASAPPLPPQASPHQAWKSISHLSAHYRVLLFNQSKMHAHQQLHLEQHRDSLCRRADASHLSLWMTAKQ